MDLSPFLVCRLDWEKCSLSLCMIKEQVLFEQWRHHQQWRNVDNVENGGARRRLLGTMTTVSEGETISNVKTVAMVRMKNMIDINDEDGGGDYEDDDYDNDGEDDDYDNNNMQKWKR